MGGLNRRLRGPLGLVVAAGVAFSYGQAIVISGGQPLLVLLPVGALIAIAIFVRPVIGLYVALVAALLFEQWGIEGLSPITAQTHFFDNISGYSNIGLRFSMADLLIVTSLLAALLNRDHGVRHWSGGPAGRVVAGYGLAFLLGAVVGFMRGGAWNESAALAELRGPAYLCVIYFLTVNMVRTRGQMLRIVTLLLTLVGLKAIEAMWNAYTMLEAGQRLEAVTSHEDVVFFDLVLILGLAAPIILGRSRITYALLAAAPPIMLAELLTQRRVAFIALAAAATVVCLCLLAIRRKATLAVLVPGLVVLAAYGAVFWNAEGAIAQPVRAIRGIVQPESISERDRLSNYWRDLENANIAFTLRELPLTGVGVGQQYLFQVEPPELTDFTYWRYMTHNAIYWVWLKGGILGFIALWAFFAQVVVTAARLVRQLHEPELALIALVPLGLVVAQVVYSAVDLGLTYSRPMIVLGVGVGLLAPLAALAHRSAQTSALPVQSRQGRRRHPTPLPTGMAKA